MKIKYRVKLFNDFTEPYWKRENVEESPEVEHKSIEEYTTYDKNAFMQILDEFFHMQDNNFRLHTHGRSHLFLYFILCAFPFLYSNI